MMFWAVQKQDINMAQIIIERMKSATEVIWDRKNKLAVSLPYAHLLTRIFSHLDIDLKGELMEKMGQAIRPRNLKKSGFSLIGNIWTKTSAAESEAIIGEAPEDPQGGARSPRGAKDSGGAHCQCPANQFQEGLVEDTSDDDDVEPTVGSGGRGRGVTPGVPLLTRKTHHGSKKKKIHVHLEPVIARLNAHRDILCSLQSDVSSIFISQSTGAKEIGAVKTELQEMRNELGSLKKLVTNLSDFVRVQLLAPAPPAPTQSMPEEVGPSGPSVTESGPPGPSLEESGPSGPCAVEDISVEPSGPSVQMESVAGPTEPQVSVEEAVVPPGPSKSPNRQTPAPSSPPTSFTAPPAPVTFKKPLPKHISSPTTFPTATSSSPPPSSSIPHPTSEAPPASSSSAGPL
ncbi:hypothetical protein Taro_022125 [Colocasia esculenta]|uniref:Uncharacterized protein n=1 Tax=Colocasia esculenta TaxID=4460 RepID=A0A843VDL3_COLES|nr:hypothetical protein [Colocasia esculenta]